MSRWQDLEKQLLSDPEVKKEYDKLQPRYALISQLIKARIKRGLTQKQLAEKVDTKQSAIARVESGNTNISIAFLEKLVKALNYQLIIKLE